MRQIQIKTKEPIKINLLVSEYGNDHSIEIVYKKQTFLYAWMTQDSTLLLDLNLIKQWVEETYYTLDFMSDAFIPCELKAQDFRKQQ